ATTKTANSSATKVPFHEIRQERVPMSTQLLSRQDFLALRICLISCAPPREWVVKVRGLKAVLFEMVNMPRSGDTTKFQETVNARNYYFDKAPLEEHHRRSGDHRNARTLRPDVGRED